MKKVFIYGDEKVLVNYKVAVEKAGGKAVISENATAAKDCDALILAGGGDVSPCFYGAIEKNCKSVSLVRDVTEQYLLALFERRAAPVLGVCRGLQLINVYFGGTLAQSITNARMHKCESGDAYHPLGGLCGFMAKVYEGNPTVNSCHRQKIDILAKGVRCCAKSRDGTIEAIEVKDSRIIGVQFHPERPFFGGDESGIKIYDYFLSAL